MGYEGIYIKLTCYLYVPEYMDSTIGKRSLESLLHNITISFCGNFYIHVSDFEIGDSLAILSNNSKTTYQENLTVRRLSD